MTCLQSRSTDDNADLRGPHVDTPSASSQTRREASSNKILIEINTVSMFWQPSLLTGLCSMHGGGNVLFSPIQIVENLVFVKKKKMSICDGFIHFEMF